MHYFYSCCGASDVNAPGCVVGRHLRFGEEDDWGRKPDDRPPVHKKFRLSLDDRRRGGVCFALDDRDHRAARRWPAARLPPVAITRRSGRSEATTRQGAPPTIVSVAVHRKRIDPTNSSSFVDRGTRSSRKRTHVPFVEDASLSTKPPFPTSYVIVACSFDTDESTPTGTYHRRPARTRSHDTPSSPEWRPRSQRRRPDVAAASPRAGRIAVPNAAGSIPQRRRLADACPRGRPLGPQSMLGPQSREGARRALQIAHVKPVALPGNLEMPSTNRRISERHEQCRVVVAPPSATDTSFGPHLEGPPVPLGFCRAQTLLSSSTGSFSMHACLSIFSSHFS